MTQQLIKAKLISAEAKNIEFMFNPTEISFESVMETKESSGAMDQKSGKPKISFSQVKGYKIKINNIVFDTYESRENVIHKYINRFKKAVEFIDTPNHYKILPLDGDKLNSATITQEIRKLTQTNMPKQHRPPIYTFIWGEHVYLRRCFIEQLNYKLTMFLADGTPVRAIIDNLTLKEADDPRPTSAPNAKNPSPQNRNADNINFRKQKRYS